MKLNSSEEYQPVLRQIDDESFQLVEGFRYLGAAGDHTVLPGMLPHTDLTSVPWFLRWFIGKYGRHTRAALLHDHMLEHGEVERAEADLAFRTVLEELDVGLIRRWIMWAAVTLGTRFNRPWWPVRALMVAWVVAMLAGVGTLVYAIGTGNWMLAIVAVVAPTPAVVLWLDQWKAGLWAGYGVAIVGIPSLAIVVFMSIYWLSDKAVALVSSQPPPTPPTAI
jgi:hypothetical protein